MAKTTMLIDLQRCSGCWTCATACKVGNKLDDDTWWLTVKTLGNGEGIDRPAGVWPNLHMSWMPMYTKQCIFCAPRIKEGKQPYCEYNCPTRAISFGDVDDPDSEIAKTASELKEKGFRIFALPAWEGTRENILYASKK